jgi:hypothetical protein
MNGGVTGVRRRLGGGIGAVGMAMILGCLGLACGKPANRAAAPTGAESARPEERPGGAQAAPWIRAVPAARLSAGAPAAPGAPAASDAGQPGTLLSAHWIAPNGSVTQTEPEGKVVAWPAPLGIPKPAPLRLRVDMPQTPSNVDVRLFDGVIDAAGAPLHEPEIVSCTQGRPGREGCAYASSGGGVDVVLPDPPSRSQTRIVLYAEWYVPFAQRPAAARSSATVSASWGFVLAMGSAP